MISFVATHYLLTSLIVSILGGVIASISARYLFACHPSTRNQSRLLGLALSLLIFGLTLIGVLTNQGLVPVDEALAHALKPTIPDTRITSLAWWTEVGGVNFLTSLTLLVSLVLIIKKQYMLATYWTGGILINTLINQALKHTLVRSRPAFDTHLIHEGGWSYTSGHASGSMIVYTLLAYLLIRTLPSRWHALTAFGFGTLIVAVGCSRIMLQVHFLSDVLGGFALSFAWALLLITLIEKKSPFYLNSPR